MLAIGEFSRVTHLSIRTLRRYHEGGLLEPELVDSSSGYRYYSAEQIPTAQVIHRLRPDISLGFLTDDKNATFDDNIARLGFIPAFYNPNYHLVTATLVKQCHDKQILIEPWTVETPDIMQQMKALGVDGIITDYPNLLK